MDFKQLESFVSVVNYKSFSKAADHLYTSQPTISTHVRQLEEECHSRLIIRTTKSLEITPRGWELYKAAMDILSIRNKLLEQWTTESKKIIHVGVSTIPSSYILPEVLPKFGEIHPDVYFNVTQNNSQDIINDMIEGKYDIGIVGMETTHKLLSCEPFYEDKMVLITPVNETYLDVDSETILSPEFLSNAPILLREQGSGTKKSIDSFWESLGIHEDSLNVVARINDQESIKNMVASGLGISLISEKASQNFVNEKRLLSFELPNPQASRSLYLITHKNYILKPYIEAFLSFMKQFYR